MPYDHTPSAENDHMTFTEAYALVTTYRDSIEDVVEAIDSHPARANRAENPRYAEAFRRRQVAEEALIAALRSAPGQGA